MAADGEAYARGAGTASPPVTPDGRNSVRKAAVGAGVAFAGLTLLTDPVFVADTPDMATSSVARLIGQDCSFLEPGHLLWRPAGFVMLRLSGAAREGAAVESVLRTSEMQLGWAAWITGLIAAVCCAVWLQRRVGSLAATAFGVAVVLVSKSFINYSQVGVSYVPALACLMGALWLQSRPRATAIADVTAGVLLGMSVLMWGTFVLALPVALAQPIIFGHDTRRDVGRTALAMVGGVLSAIVATAWVWMSLDVSSLAELRAWAATADHDISTSGIPRAILGFARSYLETGDYGRLVKRFLLGDPADPVAARELLGLPFAGLAGFYAGLLVALFAAWKRPLGRRTLVFFAVNAVPVGAFAIAWQGGDLERYLPLAPGMALLAAVAFAAARRWQRGVLAAWILLMIVPNALTLGVPAVERNRERVRSTLRDVESSDRSRLLVFSHWQDDRVQFHRNYPPDLPPLRSQFYHLLTPGNSSVDDWRQRAAVRILSAFNEGTEVFVSARLLEATPRREWAWVDGDDPRVMWRDLHQYFGSFAYGDTAGVAGDGFVRLPPTPTNHAALASRLAVTGGDAPSASPRPAVSGGCRLPAFVPAASSRSTFRQGADRTSRRIRTALSEARPASTGKLVS